MRAAAELCLPQTGFVEEEDLGREDVLPQESGGIMLLELDGTPPVDALPAVAELESPFPELDGSTTSSSRRLLPPSVAKGMRRGNV